jgi:hypothetical protein
VPRPLVVAKGRGLGWVELVRVRMVNPLGRSRGERSAQRVPERSRASWDAETRRCSGSSSRRKTSSRFSARRMNGCAVAGDEHGGRSWHGVEVAG